MKKIYPIESSVVYKTLDSIIETETRIEHCEKSYINYRKSNNILSKGFKNTNAHDFKAICTLNKNRPNSYKLAYNYPIEDFCDKKVGSDKCNIWLTRVEFDKLTENGQFYYK